MSNPSQTKKLAEIAHLCHQFLSVDQIPYKDGKAVDDLAGFTRMLLASLEEPIESDDHMLEMVYSTPKEGRRLENFFSQFIVLFICLDVKTKQMLAERINNIAKEHSYVASVVQKLYEE